MLGSFAHIDITPDKPLSPACTDVGNDPSCGVGIPLEANIAVLNDDGRRLVVVTVDWFFNSITLRDRIQEKCGGLLGSPDLLVAASHTHSSPNPDRTKWRFNPADEDYVRWAEETIAKRVYQLLVSPDWQPIVLRFGTAASDGVIHRRRRAWSITRAGLRKRMSIFPNQDGPCDREIRVLRFEKADGALMAVAWGLSCHPTEWPEPRQLSADFPGVVRVALRKKLANDLPVLFLQGFCGSLRPACIGRWPRSGALMRRCMNAVLSLVNGPGFVGFTASEYADWANRIEMNLMRALQAASKETQINPALQTRRTTISLSTLGVSGDIQEVSFQAIRMSQDLIIVAISAEVCWEYADLLQACFPGMRLWLVGYSDAVFGYLPTSGSLLRASKGDE